ncbi:MAG: hypothetical protein ABI772_05615 [Bacteroidota bacterium]
MMKLKFKSRTLVFLSLVIILLWGCKKNDTASLPALGYSYFPLVEGSTNYYQVDSIGWLGYTYDPATGTIEIDTVSYQVREVVDGFFTDNEGRETAKIIRYRRNISTDPWVLYKVYSANITSTRAERYEDNVRYIKLIFPPVNGEKWTGQYLDVPASDTAFDAWEYEYESINVPEDIGTFSFDSVLTVTQKNEINLIEFRLYQEQYAAGTGLVSKNYKDLEYLNTVSSFIKNGFIYKETLIKP